MRIIGIDPGKKGAIVTITRDEVFDSCWVNMEDMQGTLLYLQGHILADKAVVFLEKAQAMPKNGAVSMFNYGAGYGTLLGMIIALQVPHVLVPPRTWTKIMHAGASAGDPKTRSLEVAGRLFPGVRLIAPDSPRARVPHEGIIDALLIAGYGRRILGSCA